MANQVAIAQALSRSFARAPRGVHVNRPAAAIAGATTKPIFNVTGKVLVLGLNARVTTVIQTQTNNTKYVSTPTGGTAGDMSATVNTSAAAVGTRMSITGTPANAAVLNTGVGFMALTPQVVDTGVIGLSTSADNTGAMEHDIWYIPLSKGATVVAA